MQSNQATPLLPRYSIAIFFSMNSRMDDAWLHTFFFVLLLALSTGLRCPDCGSVSVPYPLSTSPFCGDPDYRVVCNGSSGGLFFPTLNGSSYNISAIYPASQRLIVRPASFLPGVCRTADIQSNGVWINQSLPFNIATGNTILYLNCTPRLLLSPLDCSSSSLCHSYLNSTTGPASVCRSAPICCTFTSGGSSTNYTIRVSGTGCSAYRSFVPPLNASLPVARWNEGIQIQWRSPPELRCLNQTDCDAAGIINSSCSPVSAGAPGERRCLCHDNFRWDSLTGSCVYNMADCATQGNCRNWRYLIAGLTSGTVLLLVSSSAVFVLYRRHKKDKEAREKLAREREEILSANSGGKSAKLFTGKEMKKATNSFSNDNILGSGGYGEVFKGILEDGTVIAVKAAKVGNVKGTEQVLNEVRILSQVNHKNLVRLLGCCVELEQPLMVYEFIPNGTLYDHLHGVYNFLPWRRRLIIAYQTAEGLAYLHSSAYMPIYHRDVKSNNILLDEKLNAKVSDFGLSRLAEPGLSHVSTCAQGTLGYLDPEYYRNYQLTDKSDVYSFGVVLLELLTSQKAIDFGRGPDDVNLAMYVQQRGDDGKLMDVVDEELKAGATQATLDTMRALGFLALGCLEEKRQNRPSMKEIAEEIEYIMNIEEGGGTPAN